MKNFLTASFLVAVVALNVISLASTVMLYFPR